MKNAIHMLVSRQNRQMNSFVITTEGGKVIVIDGGWTEDADILVPYLQKVTGQEVPHIDAWFLTHPHYDHVDAFLEIVNNRRDAVDFDRVYYNFPSVKFMAQGDKDAVKTSSLFYEALPRFADKICIVSGSDTYEFGDVSFDILYTADSEFVHNVCNNSGLVMRMRLAGKKVLFLADCGEEAGDKLLRMYGDELKSDICQMAHHGQNGCKRDLYETVRPDVCIWCTPDWLWDNNVGGGFDTFHFNTVRTREWMEAIGVTHHYIAKDGDCVCPL